MNYVYMLVYMAYLVGCSRQTNPEGHYQKAAVATDYPRCSEMGKFILEQGGSAVDAAITSMLCLGVVDPQSSSIGGGISMVVYEDKKAEALFALEKVPLAGNPYMLEKGESLGAKTIGVPRQLIGLWEAHQRYGKMEWTRLFEPVIEMARNGYTVSNHLHEVLHHRMPLDAFGLGIAALYRDKDGNLAKEGDSRTSLTYADTLEKIANNGPWEFYMGSVGKALIKDIQDQGGIITEEDFCPCNIKATWKPVAATTFQNNLTMYSTPLPGSGLLVEYILKIMDEYDISEETFAKNSSKLLLYHRFLEASKFAQGLHYYLGDDLESSTVQQVLAALRSNDFAPETRAKINDAYAIPYPKNYGKELYSHERPTDTTHISVLAANGDAVSVTTSVGFYFGSRVYSESTGIFLNNELANFFYPGFEHHPNGIKPGRSIFSTSSPAILVDSTGNVKLVIGSSGGDLMTSTNAWVILRTLWTKSSLQQAIDERRIYADFITTIIEPPEAGGFDADGTIWNIRKDLIAMGHTIPVDAFKFAVVQAILKDDQGGITAYCDKRKGGSPAGY